MKKIIVFNRNGEFSVCAMQCKDGEFRKRLEKAAEEAACDGYVGLTDDIPDKYLKKAGLKKVPVDFIEIDVDAIDSRKVSLCMCRNCSAYEEGACFHYGGHVDGFSTECDRIHGTGGYTLAYDKDGVSEIPFYTELDPKEAVSYILDVSDEDELSRIRNDIRDFLDENFDDDADVDENLWEYNNDN